MIIHVDMSIEVDPFDFEMTVDDVDYYKVEELIKEHWKLCDVVAYKAEREDSDFIYEERLADEARADQDQLVAEYYRGLM